MGNPRPDLCAGTERYAASWPPEEGTDPDRADDQLYPTRRRLPARRSMRRSLRICIRIQPRRPRGHGVKLFA
ncbi:unnamed protein product, partial [Musa textilis]